MMLHEFIEHQKRAITANFKMRNVSVASPVRMKQIKAQRRKTIRTFIIYLKLATSSATRNTVSELVRFDIG